MRITFTCEKENSRLGSERWANYKNILLELVSPTE
jgi:hypothetical protein